MEGGDAGLSAGLVYILLNQLRLSSTRRFYVEMNFDLIVQSASIALPLGFQKFFLPRRNYSSGYIWPDARPKFGHTQLLKKFHINGAAELLTQSVRFMQ